MKEHSGSKDILIADVDCTAGGKSRRAENYGPVQAFGFRTLNPKPLNPKPYSVEGLGLRVSV